MSNKPETLWDSLLKPIFETLLIDRSQIDATYQAIDWKSDRFKVDPSAYPDYYRQNFHGIEGGYLTPTAAVTYDPITQYLLPPNETWIRQDAISAFRIRPSRLLDLGCGTGSTTLLLAQTFPDAEVIGLDLSPHMLAVAEYRAERAGLSIQWRQGQAEATGFPAASFDGITLTLLLHETPEAIAKIILRECFRLLKPGGQVAILDGSQTALRQQAWLNNLFEEPYLSDYARGNLDAWLGAAGFGNVRTQSLWWLNQVSQGTKPLPDSEAESVVEDWQGVVPAI